MNSTSDLNSLNLYKGPDIFQVPTGPILNPLNAIFVPFLVFVTFIINILVCLVLLRPHMRSTTNTILTTMAVADTLTGISPIPCIIYFYTAGNYEDYVPYKWCYAYFCLTDFLPSIFHTFSIWLTVALAVQRYISVCHTSVATWLCNSRNACKAAGCLFLLAVLSHAGRFLEMKYTPINVESKIKHFTDDAFNPRENVTTDLYELLKNFNENGFLLHSEFSFKNKYYNETLDVSTSKYLASPNPRMEMESSPRVITACKFNIVDLLRPIQRTYFTIYYVNRILFIHFIPCMTLIIINGLLLRTMREGQNRRSRLLKLNKLSESRRLGEINRTTLMLVVVVALFLVVEFPSCVLFIILVVKNFFNFPNLISEENAEIATNVVNMCILLSYPMNFFIYCAMSTQFRSGFVSLFVRKKSVQMCEESRQAGDTCAVLKRSLGTKPFIPEKTQNNHSSDDD